MRLFRTSYTRKILTLMAGVTFLNMSFILAEISALDLGKKYKSLVQLVGNTGFEEEKEAGGESGESDASEVDLIEGRLIQYEFLFSSTEQRNKIPGNGSIHPGHSETFSPPPDGAPYLPC